MRIHFQSGDKTVARVCEPGPADDEMVPIPFYGNKGYPNCLGPPIWTRSAGSSGGRTCRNYGIMMVKQGTVGRTEKRPLRQIRTEPEPGKKAQGHTGGCTIHYPGLPPHDLFMEPGVFRVDAFKEGIFWGRHPIR